MDEILTTIGRYVHEMKMVKLKSELKLYYQQLWDYRWICPDKYLQSMKRLGIIGLRC